MTSPATPNSSFLKSQGSRTFLLIWLGQTVSLLGSALTSFSLGVWVYKESDSVTLYALNLLAYSLPHIVVSPFAGALVDRIDRRVAMILSDTGAGLSTLVVVLLYLSGNLQIWHIWLATLVNSTFNTIQWPAWSATQAVLVSREHLGRAGGMVQIGEAAGQLLAPIIAGALFNNIGIGGIAAIDFATFGFAILTLLLAQVPRPEVSVIGKEASGSLWKETRFGFTYIFSRKPLLLLLVFFATGNFLSVMLYSLFGPLLLDISNPETYGLISSIISLGWLGGTVFMSIWGGARRRIDALFLFNVLMGIFIALTGVRLWIPLIAIAGTGAMFTLPVMNALSQTIWQSKVEQDIQGRVFSARLVIAWSAEIPAYLLAGPLVDKIFEPLMSSNGILAGTPLGNMLTLGSGRGIGMLFIMNGLLTILISGLFYMLPALRNLENLLPDAPATPHEA